MPFQTVYFGPRKSRRADFRGPSVLRFVLILVLSAVDVNLSAFDDVGVSMKLGLSSGSINQTLPFSFQIPSRGTVVLTTNPSAELKVGSLEVSCSFPLQGSVIFDTQGNGIAGVGVSREDFHLAAPVVEDSLL